MAEYASRVKETTSTTGTGAIELAGAVTDYRTFRSQVGNGKWVPYTLFDANGTDWETGFAKLTYGTPDTLTRTYVLESTNADAALNLSAGSHTVLLSVNPATVGYRGALANISLASNIATATDTLLNLWSAEHDTDNIIDTTNNRLNIPDWCNRFRVTAQIVWNENGAGLRKLWGTYADQIWTGQSIDQGVISTSNRRIFRIESGVLAADSDELTHYLKLYARQETGSAQPLDETEDYNWLQVELLQ
ncbi:MAG: hypothetical protein ABW066_06790 [Sedimenticola sp.]